MEQLDDIIEIENYIDQDCRRYLHLMSNNEIVLNQLDGTSWAIPPGISVVSKHEAGVWHLRAAWFACEAFVGTQRGSDRRERQVVLWSFIYADRVTNAIRDAAAEFWHVFCRRPDYAAVRSFPEAMGLDVDIEVDGGCVALIESADVPEKFVMVF